MTKCHNFCILLLFLLCNWNQFAVEAHKKHKTISDKICEQIFFRELLGRIVWNWMYLVCYRNDNFIETFSINNYMKEFFNQRQFYNNPVYLHKTFQTSFSKPVFKKISKAKPVS